MAAQHGFFFSHKMKKSARTGAFSLPLKLKFMKINKKKVCLLVVRVRFSEFTIVLMKVRIGLYGITVLQFFRSTG